MTEPYLITIDPKTNLIRLAGDLTFATANEVLKQTEVLFEPISLLDIDLSDVTRSDSSGLALLVHWIRQAGNDNKKIMFHNIPAQMLVIAKASGLDELLPVQ